MAIPSLGKSNSAGNGDGPNNILSFHIYLTNFIIINLNNGHIIE